MSDVILETFPLGFPWKTLDPFLFCVYHNDSYPRANENLGPDASLQGRNIGNDFDGIDGWRMYHGEKVPGFPRHPHRGFETVTIARKGLIDHSDSLGAAARFGRGDVQWMTAGKGINHSEMFPLLDRNNPNPLELFQIWLNLPAKGKMVQPYFSMFWNDQIPRLTFKDQQNKQSEITIVAGELEGKTHLSPPPDSWASNPQSSIAIWTIKMSGNASWNVPKAESGLNRALYIFNGNGIKVSGREIAPGLGVQLAPDQQAGLVNGDEVTEMLLLQGRPIGEPVAQYGPFVMNTQEELQQAFIDYQKTDFGGWPWESNSPVHSREKGRFAIHADGKTDLPG